MTSIQPAQPYHFPAIAALNLEAYREYAAYLNADAWTTMQANLRSPERLTQHTTFLIAVFLGELVGSVAYCPPGNSRSPIPSNWASVLLLSVSPHYRRQGIGRSLLQACVQHANNDGAQTIGLFTSELMVNAHHLYDACNFYKDCKIPPRFGLKYWRYRLDLKSTTQCG